MSSMPFTVRWGIMATGGIAETFVKDLFTNPIVREVDDVHHAVAAVASSSSTSRAEEFLQRVEAPSTTKAYGSYAELVKDPDVDVIYVATPHSHHFQNVMLALEAGKPVLCEKSFTVNAAQARKLVATAKAKNLFLMEAVWTRYFPLSIKVREMVSSGEIGKVHRVVAELAFNKAKDDGSIDFPDEHRMVNLDLAGGALLDLGIYALTWVFQILYHCQPTPREAPNVIALMNKYERTGADAMTNAILTFPKHQSVGIAMTGLVGGCGDEGIETRGSAIKIHGTKGEIHILGRAYRPNGYRVIMNDKPGEVVDVHCPIPADKDRGGWGHGMFWEADEVARCLRDGKLQSETLNWDESVLIMDTMDEMRKQGGLSYPDLIEGIEYNPKSPLNLGKT